MFRPLTFATLVIPASIVKHFDWAGYSQQRRRTYFNTVSEDNKNNLFRPKNG